MSCEQVQERISPLLDRKISAGERESVLAHLESCGKCSAHLELLQELRRNMRNMQRTAVPPALTANLRVMASHERQRQLARVTIAARFAYWCDRTRLCFDNLMRPNALPFAGGLLSALLLFSILVPTLSFHHNFGEEEPTSVFTYPDGKVVGAFGYISKLEPVNAFVSRDETVIMLTIDDVGRVRDYSLISGKLTTDMESIILLSRFNPATLFGQPTWGKVQVSLRPMHSMRG